MRDRDAWLKALVSTLDSVDRPLADQIGAIKKFDQVPQLEGRTARFDQPLFSA